MRPASASKPRGSLQQSFRQRPRFRKQLFQQRWGTLQRFPFRVLDIWAEICSIRRLKIAGCKLLMNGWSAFDLLRSAEQFVPPDSRRRAARFLAQTFYASRWRLIKAIYLIERSLVHGAAPLSKLEEGAHGPVTPGFCCTASPRR